jgi:glutamate dehydrogenase (NAD(P)+)
MLNVSASDPSLSGSMLFEWDLSPARQRSLHNFRLAADVLKLDKNTTARLQRPEHIIIVALPIRMDNGDIQVFTGYRVQHNDSRGPYKGGIRYHPDVDLGEVTSLAMAMTWKTALMNLPLGGAKGGIQVDPLRLSRAERQGLTRRYTAEILPNIGPKKDIPAPDMGTNEQTMAWIMDTYSQHMGGYEPAIVTGKPVDFGGSAMRREATGRGVVYCIEEAAKEINLDLRGATFVTHGYGNVGSVAAIELVNRGATCVGLADVSGGYVNLDGIPMTKINEHLREAETFEGFNCGDRISANDVLTVPCDIVIPAAVGQVITEKNAPKMQCRILAEGANGPTMPEADPILLENGTYIIPDILCNAGGVTVSYFEWVQGGMGFFWSEQEIDERLSRLIKEAFHKVRHFSDERGISNRIAALATGIARVDRTMRWRGLYA